MKKSIVVGFIVFFFLVLIYILNDNDNYSKIDELTHEIGFYFESLFTIKNYNIDDNVIDGINLELEEEVNNLKDMLNLDNSQYKFIHANVIKRDLNFYQTLTIDKGKKDGINLDMAVISNNSLIGRVIKVTNSSSVIKLLSSSNDDMKVSVIIKSNDLEIHGILNKYFEKENLIQVDSISKSADIKVGDKVYTSGLGGIYPNGIYIGEVLEIGENDLGINQIVKIKPQINYDNIRFVSVIDRS